MASPSTVVVDTAIAPVFASQPRLDSAQKTSNLLQANLEKHHIFFNYVGFHNHIVHHLLTIYALGASPEEIQSAYDNNASYQRPLVQGSKKHPSDLDDAETWQNCLGKENHYQDFINYFRRDIERSSVDAVLTKYLFAGDERANDLLSRLFSGLLHPLIHLGFGVEFKQPVIVEEGLAQAAVHDNRIGKMMSGAEKAAAQSGRKTMDRSIASLIDEAAAAKADSKAPDNTVRLLSQVVVAADEIKEKTAEMMNTALYFTACALRSGKGNKIDFYLLHCVTSSAAFPALVGSASALSTAAKKRLLEYKIRMDIGMYIFCGAPRLHLDKVRNAQAKHPSGWSDVFRRVRRYPDDGHASKFIRAVAAIEQQCKGYESDKERFRIRGDDYLTIAHMVMDSIEGLEDESSTEPRWTRPTPEPSVL